MKTVWFWPDLIRACWTTSAVSPTWLVVNVNWDLTCFHFQNGFLIFTVSKRSGRAQIINLYSTASVTYAVDICNPSISRVTRAYWLYVWWMFAFPVVTLLVEDRVWLVCSHIISFLCWDDGLIRLSNLGIVCIPWSSRCCLLNRLSSPISIFLTALTNLPVSVDTRKYYRKEKIFSWFVYGCNVCIQTL